MHSAVRSPGDSRQARSVRVVPASPAAHDGPRCRRVCRVAFAPARLVLLAVAFLGVLQGDDSWAQTKPRTPWSGSRVRGTPEPPPPLVAVNAFPEVRFRNPVALSVEPGGGRMWVAEQGGKLFSFPLRTTAADRSTEGAAAPARPVATPSSATVAIDLADWLAQTKSTPPSSARSVDNRGLAGLEALYGLAFHPRFAENRYCYLTYVVRDNSGQQRPDGTRVSRFTVTKTDPPTLDPASERVMITWLQGGHNGGCLAFGPDGCLYISTGDGGFANPPDGRDAGQDVGNLLSSILRIDVDHPAGDGQAYSIPADNPFVNLPGARGEIWCYGLRNPWKMSFDRATGDLWVADVGWELWELVYRVAKGGNYGWSVVEGRQSVHPRRKIGPTPILPPTIEIPHTDGVSITGGYVYRGKRFPELVGSYLFGDWETRRIWASRWDAATQSASPPVDVIAPTVRLVAFAEDIDGELFLLDYDEGTILAPERAPPQNANAGFPRRLSETGLFQSVSEHTPAAGVVRFEVNVEQWVDGARAERWIGIPGSNAVKFLPGKKSVAGSMFSGQQLFPVDTVLLKTLSVPDTDVAAESRPDSAAHWRRVETQLLHFDGRTWRGYSYAWNSKQTDAELVDAAGRETTLSPTQSWRFASRVECARCHNPWAEFTLGFNLRQLHRAVRSSPAIASVAHDDGKLVARTTSTTTKRKTNQSPVGMADGNVADQHAERPETEAADATASQLELLGDLGVIELPEPPTKAPPSPPAQTNPATNAAADTGNGALADDHELLRRQARRAYLERLERFAGWDSPGASLEAQVRSYLHVNCAHCHRVGGGGTASFELRYELPVAATRALDVRPSQGTFELPDARIIAAGDPYRSTLFYRIAKTGAGRMPHIGSEVVDWKAVQAVERWIRELPTRSEEQVKLAELRALAEKSAAIRPRAPLPSSPPATASDEPARRRGVLINELLSQTSSALFLLHAVRQAPLPEPAASELLAAARGAVPASVRELFEPLQPLEFRPSRPTVLLDPTRILAVTGDATRGRQLFFETASVQCKNCHRVDGTGSSLGPDLSQIGSKYTRAQLLDQILEPSRIIEPRYVAYVAQLDDGRSFTGMLMERTPQFVLLRDAKGDTTRIASEQLESLAPLRQSLMPDLQLRDLSVEQIADLLAYLSERKVSAVPADSLRNEPSNSSPRAGGPEKSP